MPDKYPCSGKLSLLHKKLLGKSLSFSFCCEEHDFAYDEGGTDIDRKLADSRFKSCISTYSKNKFKKVWLNVVAFFIYFSVRLFGGLYFNYKK